MLTKSAVTAICVALTFSCPAWAADTSATAPASTASSSGPLAPGQAAGIRRAQETPMNNTLLAVGGLTVLGVGIGLLASDNGHHSTSTSTSTTSTGGH